MTHRCSLPTVTPTIGAPCRAPVSRTLQAAALGFLLAGSPGCSPYEPPIAGDHGSDKYKDDLQKCQTTSQEAVRIKNADTPWTWIISPFTGPPAVRAAIRACMQRKGYVVLTEAR